MLCPLFVWPDLHAEFEGLSLYWDRNVPQPSIFTSHSAIRLELRTEPLGIFVCQASLANPDVHVGDAVLAIDDVKAPLSRHSSAAEQQYALER